MKVYSSRYIPRNLLGDTSSSKSDTSMRLLKPKSAKASSHPLASPTACHRTLPKKPEIATAIVSTVKFFEEELPRGATKAEMLATQQSNLQIVSEATTKKSEWRWSTLTQCG